MNVESHKFETDRLVKLVSEAIEFFIRTPVCSLPPTAFSGTGVYALYYTGNFDLYRRLSDIVINGEEIPIYVGKAVPSGWRTGRAGVAGSRVLTLQGRLRQHARSIEQANNLLLKDFYCRFMILSDYTVDLIAPVEAELIRRFNPLWNCVIDGFGNHDPGSGRYNQRISEWDVIHSGREWVDRLTGKAPNKMDIKQEIYNYMNAL